MWQLEWALAAAGKNSLDLIGNPWKKPAFQGKYIPQQVVEGLFGSIRFTRLYFGQEFCDHLIPEKGELAEAVMKSLEKGMEFTLVTPCASVKSLGRLEKLLAYLGSIKPSCEVICNDWGLIYLIRRSFPSLVPVMGRLLNKAYRDPRINNYLKDIPERDRALYRFSSSSNQYLRDLLKILRVARVEMDNLPQGMAGGLPGRGLTASLYIPNGFVATGRICFSGSWGLQQSKKFMSSGGGSCSRLCRRYLMEMRDLSGCLGGEAVDGVFQKGNTVFYRHSENLLQGGLKAARDLGIDRIVYQPEPL